MGKITIPYKPRAYFLPFHESGKRWNVIVAHRRSGKTTATLNHLLRAAVQTIAGRYAFIAPFRNQAKGIAWDVLKHYTRVVPGIEYNEQELSAKLPNGSRIALYGADNPDALRGLGFNGVVFDEYSQQPSNIFSEIIRPALVDSGGFGVWIGTPKGKNDFWQLYKNAGQDWYKILLSVEDTKIIPEDELDSARSTMSEDEYAQEFMCSFEAAIKGAYYAEQLRQAREDGRITGVPYESHELVHTWWDLGIGDATAILFMQKVVKEWHLIDYYEASGEGLQHYIQMLKEKGYIYGNHYAPHDIEVKELGTGQSRKEIAQKLGIKFQVAPRLSIEDGINAVRMKFNQLWIDEKKCDRLLHCLSLYRKEWDEKRGQFKNQPLHDFTSNSADALRYWAVTKYRDPYEPTFTQYRPSWVSRHQNPV
jgi:hypothetical protein